MDSLTLIDEFLPELIAIRHDLHANPEIGFPEQRTSAIVAAQLESWGIEVHRNIGGTGIVGVLQGKLGAGRMVGLRADMDALPMQEQTGLPCSSRTDGKFHGCGHDGHTTIPLAAARNFAGTAVLIFQPAKEGLGGARAMLKDGLFDRFPCERIYGFHNWPDLSLGQIAVVPDACGPARTSSISPCAA